MRPAYVIPVVATWAETASVCVMQWLPMPRPVWTRACVWTGGPQTSAVSVSPHAQTCSTQGHTPEASLQAGTRLFPCRTALGHQLFPRLSLPRPIKRRQPQTEPSPSFWHLGLDDS